MLGGDRRQRAISGDAFRLLGTGMDPASLGRFLRDPEAPSGLPKVDVEALKRERDLARSALLPYQDA